MPDNPEREDESQEQPPGETGPDDTAGEPGSWRRRMFNIDLTGQESGPFGPWPT